MNSFAWVRLVAAFLVGYLAGCVLRTLPAAVAVVLTPFAIGLTTLLRPRAGKQATRPKR